MQCGTRVCLERIGTAVAPLGHDAGLYLRRRLYSLPQIPGCPYPPLTTKSNAGGRWFGRLQGGKRARRRGQTAAHGNGRSQGWTDASEVQCLGVCVCDCWVSLAVLSTFHFKTHIYRVESRDRWGNFAVVLTILQSKLLNHRKRWFPGPATPPLVILSGSAFRLLLMMINPKNSMDIFWL